MAIVKNNYVKPNGREKAKAKATIRYIQNRPGQDNTKTSRTLFTSDGPIGRHEAYRLIDEAEKGSVFFRFVISPDSKTEDTNRDLRLRDVIEHTMLSFEEHIKQQVQWVAAVHADHTPLRHVHIVAVVPLRMQRAEFQTLPQVLRQAATDACLEQRQELDVTQAHQTQEREEAVPDSLLLGTTNAGFVAIRPTQERRELGNLLVVAPTRGGKGLLAVSQLLSWQHSVVVNDIKGELFATTAGYRSTLGKVFVIDPTGIGHHFDPLYGKNTEDELYSLASHLLFEAEERERIFTQRATVMLTQLFLAARIAGISPFPYVRSLIRLGMADTAGKPD